MSEARLDHAESAAERWKRQERRLGSRLNHRAYNLAHNRFEAPAGAGVAMREPSYGRRAWLGFVRFDMAGLAGPTDDPQKSITDDPDRPGIGYRVKVSKRFDGKLLNIMYTRYTGLVTPSRAAIMVESVTVDAGGQVTAYEYFPLGGFNIPRSQQEVAMKLDSGDGSIATAFLEEIASTVYGEDLRFNEAREAAEE